MCDYGPLSGQLVKYLDEYTFLAILTQYSSINNRRREYLWD